MTYSFSLCLSNPWIERMILLGKWWFLFIPALSQFSFVVCCVCVYVCVCSFFVLFFFWGGDETIYRLHYFSFANMKALIIYQWQLYSSYQKIFKLIFDVGSLSPWGWYDDDCRGKKGLHMENTLQKTRAMNMGCGQLLNGRISLYRHPVRKEKVAP